MRVHNAAPGVAIPLLFPWSQSLPKGTLVLIRLRFLAFSIPVFDRFNMPRILLQHRVVG